VCARPRPIDEIFLDSDVEQGEAGNTVAVDELPTLPTSFVVGVGEHMIWALNRLDDFKGGTTEALKRLVQRGPISTGSMCTGLGTFEMTLDALENSLKNFHGLDPQTEVFRRRFMCEKDSKKIAYLKRAHPNVEAIYTDMVEVGAGSAQDVKSGHWGPAPYVDLFLCGYPCKTLSGLTIKRKTFTDTAEPTGSGFDSTMGYIQQRKPAMVGLENVREMTHKRKMDVDEGLATPIEVQHARMIAMGYTTSHRVLNTERFGLPQSRHRTWSWYILEEQGDAVDVAEVVSMLEVKHVPIAKCLSTEIRKIKQTAWQRPGNLWEAQATTIVADEKLGKLHFKQKVNEITHLFIGILPREAAVAAILLLRYGKRGVNIDEQTLILQVDQMPVRSTSRVNIDVSPCICPSAKYIIWSPDYKRWVQPKEYLKFQARPMLLGLLMLLMHLQLLVAPMYCGVCFHCCHRLCGGHGCFIMCACCVSVVVPELVSDLNIGIADVLCVVGIDCCRRRQCSCHVQRCLLVASLL
jgi:site-specific DNA-cytosine methylase